MGLVLLIGMVAVGSAGIFLVAGETIGDVEQETENERISQSFVELRQSLDGVSAGPDTSGNINLDAGKSGAIAKDETGYMKVESEGLDEDINLTFGTVEYVSDDGTKIAYEAGGVFRETGYETRVVSSPNIQYDLETETLSLPVLTVTGDEQLGSGDISMAHNETTTYAESSVVENESVDITIRSEYWRGWVTFFEQQAGDTTVRDIEQLDGDAAKVTVRVGYLEFDEAFEGSMVLPEGEANISSGGGGSYDDDEIVSGSIQELDPIINEMLEDENVPENRIDPIDGSESAFENGTYFTESVHLDNGNVEFDVSEGNITLLVNESVKLEHGNRILVTGTEDNPENSLKIYVREDLHAKGDLCVDPCGKEEDGEVSAENLQIYGTSEMHGMFGSGQEAYLEGILYAPIEGEFDEENKFANSNACRDVQICFQSNTGSDGSIAASSIGLQGGPEIAHDPELTDADIDLYPEEYALPPQLTFLNVAHHELEVRNQ
ncbi:hypothetical protein GS429_08895 [Natronorubrum sp. JWXQ-INN-674]|uniref:DUF7305 domain-containing protein n=2 Tax=Natronorubrum halalkaliphilum TaxID=2691917 RepID=A0A6B0VKT5_9EURY|nr:hypothetical protein [Natronorubrum halalkaliphilum]MXV62174.1 hypothetical protein [Natronorubrum halalkaliphilum]